MGNGGFLRIKSMVGRFLDLYFRWIFLTDSCRGIHPKDPAVSHKKGMNLTILLYIGMGLGPSKPTRIGKGMDSQGHTILLYLEVQDT